MKGLIKTLRTFALLAATTACLAAPLKLGTLVPVGTSYHKILMGMGEGWKRDSNGATELKIFAGGKLGGEAEMVGLMMQNNLQAAVLTAVGLSEIEPAIAAVQNMPMVFRDLEELDYVVEHIRPLLESKLEAKGFVVLFWTDAGWIRFFSKKPAGSPAELKRQKLFCWSGNVEQAELMKKTGFTPVSLETADIVLSLQSGLLEAVPLPPFFALAVQIDKLAPYMSALDYAPLVGACVVRKDVWERAPVAVRAKLAAAALDAGKKIKETSRRESVESVLAMEKRGLKVVKPSEAELAEWRRVGEELQPLVRGRMVPADVFDEVMRLVAEYRKTP